MKCMICVVFCLVPKILETIFLRRCHKQHPHLCTNGSSRAFSPDGRLLLANVQIEMASELRGISAVDGKHLGFAIYPTWRIIPISKWLIINYTWGLVSHSQTGMIVQAVAFFWGKDFFWFDPSKWNSKCAHTQKPLQPLHLIFYSKKSTFLVGNLYTINLHLPMLLFFHGSTNFGYSPNITPRFAICLSMWWFQLFFIFTPTWGDDPIWLCNIFLQMSWNHQAVKFSLISLGQHTDPALFLSAALVETKAAFHRELRGLVQCAVGKLSLFCTLKWWCNGFCWKLKSYHGPKPRRKPPTTKPETNSEKWVKWCKYEWNDANTVDGSEIRRSPVEGKVVEIPLCTRFYTYQAVQDFVQQYHGW